MRSVAGGYDNESVAGTRACLLAHSSLAPFGR
jgi:hypothetical protein